MNKFGYFLVSMSIILIVFIFGMVSYVNYNYVPDYDTVCNHIMGTTKEVPLPADGEITSVKITKDTVYITTKLKTSDADIQKTNKVFTYDQYFYVTKAVFDKNPVKKGDSVSILYSETGLGAVEFGYQLKIVDTHKDIRNIKYIHCPVCDDGKKVIDPTGFNDLDKIDLSFGYCPICHRKVIVRYKTRHTCCECCKCCKCNNN